MNTMEKQARDKKERLRHLLLLYTENHSLGEWFKRGFCRWGKIKLPLL